MQYRTLGTTGLRVSAISFGAGPVSGLMTSGDLKEQAAVVERALALGINWFDTAATYGNGQSEQSLGDVLSLLGARENVHVATKARLMPDDLGDIPGCIRASVTESMSRLQRPRFTLLQLHNSVTRSRGDEPTSLAPRDVLGPGGVLEAFEELRANGVVDHFGLTGIGQPAALREVVASGAFATMQVPYHLLNPSAGEAVPKDFHDTDYGNVIADCVAQGMGVFVIRVFAAGALLGNRPSEHTKRTPFFPLDLYKRDAAKAKRLHEALDAGMDMHELAIRFVLNHPGVTSAILGFGEPAHVDKAVNAISAGPLSPELLESIRDCRARMNEK